MEPLPWQAKLYITLLVLLAFVIGSTLVLQTPVPTSAEIGRAALVTALLVVALAFPLHIAPKTKLSLHTGVVFAATVLFPPGIAGVIVLAGTIIADVPRRQPLDQTSFNAAQLMLQVAVCGTFLQVVGWSIVDIAHFASLLEIVVAAVMMTVLELAAVAGVISLQTAQPLVPVMRQLAKFDPVEWMTQYALGMVGAIVLRQHLWLLPLLVPPAILLYRSGRRQAQMHTQAALLEYQAFHDALTGLPNRALLQDRLQHALANAPRTDRWVGVLFLDLDGFKTVNDQLGHAAGDQVLRSVAQRLVPCVRPADTVARFGGDEFVVLLDDLPDLDVAREVAERIGHAVGTPLRVKGQNVTLTTSIGAVVSQRSDDTADTLLRAADAALYEAKASGKANYVVAQSPARGVQLRRSRIYVTASAEEYTD